MRLREPASGVRSSATTREIILWSQNSWLLNQSLLKFDQDQTILSQASFDEQICHRSAAYIKGLGLNGFIICFNMRSTLC